MQPDDIYIVYYMALADWLMSLMPMSLQLYI